MSMAGLSPFVSIASPGAFPMGAPWASVGWNRWSPPAPPDRFQRSNPTARPPQKRTLPSWVGSSDWWQWVQTQPTLNMPPWQKWLQKALHPWQYQQMKERLAVSQSVSFGAGQRFGLNTPLSQSAPADMNVQEDPSTFQEMYNKVADALDPPGRQALENLLRQNVLQDRRTDDGHSALYHLYGILTTDRMRGYDPKTILKETVEILNNPASITQKFGPLSDKSKERLLAIENNSVQPGMYKSLTGKFLRAQDLDVESSATCVASSLMFYMADKEPAELARQIKELTSPMNAFVEKVRPEEISPDDPSKAEAMLKESGIPFLECAPGQWVVKVANPPAGQIRAFDSQRYFDSRRYRNAVETAYQSAVTHLAAPSYDPATDFRDSDTPGEGSKGLTEQEKTLMETVIKENGGVQSITYQTVASRSPWSAQKDDHNSCLYGYKRSFEQTADDIIQSLKMGEPVIVGLTDTDPSGAILNGHEITITGAWTDPSDHQLKFMVADSDDGIPTLVTRSARELLPAIHHAGLPLPLAKKIQNEMRMQPGNSLFLPDETDAKNFKLLAIETAPMLPVEEELPVNRFSTSGMAGYMANPGFAATKGYALASSPSIAAK